MQELCNLPKKTHGVSIIGRLVEFFELVPVNRRNKKKEIFVRALIIHGVI